MWKKELKSVFRRYAPDKLKTELTGKNINEVHIGILGSSTQKKELNKFLYPNNISGVFVPFWTWVFGLFSSDFFVGMRYNYLNNIIAHEQFNERELSLTSTGFPS